ncbi:MAG TPA: glycogen/starch synthase, partial [Bacteroidota bacterium]|nr:glycogen/starch synthase [Bacteroidota bacterium]
MELPQHVIMVAGENDALKNGKVGGVGDVIRDLPRALADLGWVVTVITPSYGFLHIDNPSTQIDTVHFPFGGKMLEGNMYEVTARLPHSGVRNYVFEHSAIRGTPIYFNDPPDEPFAQDGTKYALFCSAVGQYLKKFPSQIILHLHDWHTGMLLFLREMHRDFSHLKKFKTAFTIHNLAIQGNRPFRGKYATTEQWFPELFHDAHWIEQWKDPRYPIPNLTPMAIGIEHADAVNTVSPTYAEEILLPSDPKNGNIRGEGLEKILQRAKQENRLFGILNGCDYPESRIPPRMSFPALCDLIIAEVTKWNTKNADPVNDEIIHR